MQKNRLSKFPRSRSAPSSSHDKQFSSQSLTKTNKTTQTDSWSPLSSKQSCTTSTPSDSTNNLQYFTDVFNKVSLAADLDSAINNFTATLCQPHKDPKTNVANRPFNPNEAAKQIQQLYRQDPKKAMDQVRGGSATACPISTSALHTHFCKVHAKNNEHPLPMPSIIPNLPTPDTDDPLSTPLSPKFVAKCLSETANTAPGPDKIRYTYWRKGDPNCIATSALFNATIRLKHYPKAWKESITVLIDKKGDINEVSNWRPIALSNTLAKLFAACMAKRLTDWAIRNNRLSRAQKGFLKFEGCLEHNFELQSIIQDARRLNQTAVICWLDLRNAFGSVSHSIIMTCLRWAGLGTSAIDVIERLYQDCTTRVRSLDGITRPIPIKSGVKHCCPLSPIVFNLVIEPMLRAITEGGDGYCLNHSNIAVQGYADDMTIIGRSVKDMNKMLTIASTIADWAGLHFNGKKCASLHIDGKHYRVNPTSFKVQNDPIKVMDKSDSYRHLGIPTGFKYGPTGDNIIKHIEHEIQQIDQSLLAPWQKINAVNVFSTPKLSFHMRGSRMARAELGKLDNAIKKVAKTWLNLPNRASTEPLYLSNKQGGFNMMPFKIMADISDVVQAIHLLASIDPQVRHNANLTLKKVVQKRVGKANTVTPVLIADYLNGKNNEAAKRSPDISSLWTRLRVSTTSLRRMIPLNWSNNNETGLSAFLGTNKIKAATAESQLRAAYRAHLLDRLKAKKDQGKTAHLTSQSSVSNHFMKNGNYTRFAEYRFIHRARLGVVPLRGCLRFDHGPRECRKCGYADETLPHVLNNCNTHKTTMTHRHDAVLHRIKRSLKQEKETQILTNQSIPNCASSLRPDLVVINNKSKVVTIIDVTIPFENGPDAFEKARTEKKYKYKDMEDQFKKQGYKTFNDAFIIGALGAYDPANEASIRRLGIPHKYATLMKRLMVCDVIRWSRDIYIEHVSGIRQYETTATT